jgi:hypothetical protein
LSKSQKVAGSTPAIRSCGFSSANNSRFPFVAQLVSRRMPPGLHLAKTNISAILVVSSQNFMWIVA